MIKNTILFYIVLVFLLEIRYSQSILFHLRFRNCSTDLKYLLIITTKNKKIKLL
jgi:hypothetical protein